MITESMHVDVAGFEAATGWTLEAAGACRGDVCVPLPEGAVTGGVVDVEAVAGRLGMPVVHDEERQVWAIGPATVGGRALATVAAPDLVLPTIDGRPFRLSSLRGQKVVLVAWAPY